MRDGFGRNFEKMRRMPFFVGTRKVGKRQVRQMNRFALRAQGVEKRQTAKDVVAATRAREENGLGVAQFVEKGDSGQVHIGATLIWVWFSFG